MTRHIKTVSPTGHVTASYFPRDQTTWWMQWLFALDQVRSIAKFNRSHPPLHDRDGGDDHTFYKSINTALRMLDCYNDKKALEIWSKERTEWSEWATERLGRL